MNDKSLRWLHGEVKTPPMSVAARREMGMLLRDVQEGEMLSLPQSRHAEFWTCCARIFKIRSTSPCA